LYQTQEQKVQELFNEETIEETIKETKQNPAQKIIPLRVNGNLRQYFIIYLVILYGI
jgi:hypothetical protein